MKKILILIILLFSGCSFAPKTTLTAAIYDFGLQPVPNISSAKEQPPADAPSLFIDEIKTPVWLDSPAIHYRLAYHDKAQFHTYANSRWIASPAALLTQRIRNQFSMTSEYSVIKPGDSARADYILHLNLEEFIQVFEATDSSHVVISVHASLIARQSRAQIAQRRFQLQRPATTNAVGAVHALIETSNQLSNDLIVWLTNELKNKKESPYGY